MKPGFTLQEAELESEQVARALSAAYPATNGKIGALTIPLLEAITGEVRPALTAAWIAVGLVLLIACANLGHLMMSRALQRRHEIALRLALGASRFATFRMFLLETGVLGVVGGLSGILAADIALPLIQRSAQGQVPRLESAHINASVLLFGLLASLVVSLVFALPSYLGIFRSDLTESISSMNARSSVRRSWLNPVMMGSEVALALAVVLAAILLVRSFYLTLQTPPGFQSADVLTVHVPLVDRDWTKSYDLLRNRIVPGLRSIPGIEQVAAVNSVPMSLGTTEHSRYATRFGIVGRQFESGRFPTAQIRWCTPDYFKALGIPLLYGRLLTAADHGQPRYLINETFARQFFPHSNPVGQKLLLGVVTPHPEPAEIVGLVGDVREFGLTSIPEPTMYDVDVSPEMDVVVKAATTDAAVRNAISATLRRLNPQRAIGPVRTLDSYIAASLARQLFLLALIATFAALAISLCAVGIYGVFTYSVARRMREFGIRAAVGAGKRDLILQVMKECLAVIVPGVVAGLAISAACSQFMRSLLYRVSPTDALSAALSLICILVLSASSVMIPALRAARADPATILREQ